jgi:hypothetical protein
MSHIREYGFKFTNINNIFKMAVYKFIETHVTISKHFDVCLSVNLFARGGAYDTFPV